MAAKKAGTKSAAAKRDASSGRFAEKGSSGDRKVGRTTFGAMRDVVTIKGDIVTSSYAKTKKR
jgi:hypothetical protein